MFMYSLYLYHMEWYIVGAQKNIYLINEWMNSLSSSISHIETIYASAFFPDKTNALLQVQSVVQMSDSNIFLNNY